MRNSDQRPEETMIPLLEDVVDPAELDHRSPSETSLPPRLRDREALITGWRQGVSERLLHELQPLLASAVEGVVDQVMAQATRSLREELEETLEKRLHGLIREALERALQDPPHPLSDSNSN